jgi:protein-S-isoprenylcysteine O-methyltransferase Ste14
VRVAGIVLAAAGIAGTAGAQLAMGRAWRIGVDPTERTNLVTGGPFALVRNPIYAAMIPFFAGIALIVGNVVGLAAVACAVTSLELQTRVVEEPHLLRTHGEEYASYAARVGRFVPGVGRLSR